MQSLWEMPEQTEQRQREEPDDRHRTVTAHFIWAYPHLFHCLRSAWTMSDLIDLYFNIQFPNTMYFSYIPFWTSEICRRVREHARNLRNCFYRPVGRFRSLRVLARRLVALTRGASLDARKVLLGDLFGNKH